MMRALLGLFFLAINTASVSAAEVNFQGYIEMEARYFNQRPSYPQQESESLSLAFEPEIYGHSDDRKDSFSFRPFYRIDNTDDNRTRGDIRELYWLHVANEYEVKLGVSRVFWGVAESNHLVDIINQTDFAESYDREVKLGQQMIHFSSEQNFGLIDVFVLPGFRERTYTGEKGRFRPPIAIDKDNAMYQSSSKDKHIDYAARLSNSFDDTELAFSVFRGTSREPIIVPLVNGSEVSLTPYYQIITQAGVEGEWLLEDWTFKFEGLYRKTQNDDFTAAVMGFEYTDYSIFTSAYDLGYLVEYHVDKRRNKSMAPFQNDTFLGLRLSFNDVNSSSLLAGVIYDHDHGSESWFFEAATRVYNDFTMNINGQVFNHIPSDDLPLYIVKNDDFIELEIKWNF